MKRIHTACFVAITCLSFATFCSAQASNPSRIHVEVATIKPTPAETQDELFTIRGHHVVTIGTSLMELVKFAYGLHPSQIADAQPWMTKERFDLDAVVDTQAELNNDHMRDVVRELLTDRFHLRYRMETEPLPAFALLLTGGDLRLKTTDRMPGQPVDMYGSHGELNVRNASMQDFATGLSRGLVARPVVDQTGLTGRYDFVLKWTQDGVNVPDTGAPPDLFAAMPEEIGLKLKATRANLPVLHIEAATHPTEN